MGRLFSLWRNLVHRDRVDRDLDEELRATFELLVDENALAGMAPEDARRAARLTLGSTESLKDKVGDVRTGASLDTLLQDIRYSLRMVRRAPGFTALAVATLALGIGANAAIFGVVKSVLLDALPYAKADRLVRVYAQVLDGAQQRFPMTARMVDTITAGQQAFDSVAAFASARDAVYGGDAARIVSIAWVEPHLFQTLGVSAALGRTFTPEDRAAGHVPASGAEVGPDTAHVVIVSHDGWQRLFAGDSNIVGRDVRINAIPRTVIGVMPRGFIAPMGPADFYFAFDLHAALGSGAGWLGVVGRLKPDATLDIARREVSALWASRPTSSEFDRIGMSTVPLREALVGSTRTPLLVLLASAALVLLIACANLAGALLSRGLSRRREFAVRFALGAGRRRILRQLLTESMLLALAGGAAGLLLANSLLSGLRALPTAALPAYADLSLDPEAVIVIGLLSIVTGIGFGLVPALATIRSDAHRSLRDEARGASEGLRPRRLRGLLVAGQMALCASLLGGAGLLARSLWVMSTAPLGFDDAGVLTARFRLSTTDYPTLDVRARLHEQLIARLQTLPGVTSVALAHKIPTVDPRTASFSLDTASRNAPDHVVVYGSVSDDYFRTLRIPLREGRTFDTSDRTDGQPTAVISESLARAYWSGGRALGSRIRLDGDPVTIVGIVGDVRSDLARRDVEPVIYRSHRQESTQRFCVLIRTRGDPLALVRPLEREVAALDASLPVQQPMTLDAAVGEGLAARRLPVMLMTAFGGLALLLVSVGVYAMFASIAAAREREFGIRVALGSGAGAIATLMVRQGAGWMAAGLGGGAIGAMIVIRIIRSLVDGIPRFDPVAFALAIGIMMGCATIALLIPVRRATRVDPMIVLRGD